MDDGVGQWRNNFYQTGQLHYHKHETGIVIVHTTSSYYLIYMQLAAIRFSDLQHIELTKINCIRVLFKEWSLIIASEEG